MRNKILFALALWLGFSLLKAQTFDIDKIESLFTLIESNDKGMGSISVFRDGKEVYSRSYGYADVEKQLKADKNTKYQIGSITKTFTATLIMKLVEAGKLSLSTNLGAFYPQVPNADKITIGHLLQHRSGIANFTTAADYAEWHTRKHSKAELLERIVAGSSNFGPDEKFEYSNSNYVLLTFIAEDVSGKPFPDLLRELIFIPCELSHTYVGNGIDPSNGEAHSYIKLASGWKKEPETDLSIPLGAGSIVSTPHDLNLFYNRLFAGKIVSPESLAQMVTLKNNFGFGLFRVPLYETTGYGHTGGLDGFQSNAFYFPDYRLSIALTANGVVYPLNDIVVGVLTIYLGKEYRLPEFTETVVISEQELRSYPGTYASALLPIKITITQKEGTLFVQATGQPALALEYVGENKFKYDPVGVELEFMPEENKMIFRQRGMEFEMERETEE